MPLGVQGVNIFAHLRKEDVIEGDAFGYLIDL